MIPYTRAAYQLFHEGALAFAKAEGAGIRIDMGYVEGAIVKSEKKAKRLTAELESTKMARVWRKRYGHKTNYGSDDQLRRVLFDDMGHTATTFTAKSTKDNQRPAVGDAVLSGIDDPFIKTHLEIKKIKKDVSTYLKAIQREVVDDKLHCFFNLHTVKTYRSSSDRPNMHNMPIRREESAKLIRRAFIPRPGRQLVEIDFSGAEVRMAANYNHDPVLIDYIFDPAKDMHRDMAMQLYKLPQNEVSKPIRHCAKNQFVFAEFYGDWYLDCAKGLWGLIDKQNLVTTSGVPLHKHLRRVGLGVPGSFSADDKPVKGTFVHHVKAVEEDFWGNRFKVYKQWKWDWLDKYNARGWLKTKTGFVCQGYMKKNEVINYPVQGSSFHCLLWVFNELVLRELRRRKMRTTVVCQIHDSILADVVPEELPEYLGLCNELITTRLSKHWPWMRVPMSAEAEAAPVGGTWNDKKGIALAA